MNAKINLTNKNSRKDKRKKKTFKESIQGDSDLVEIRNEIHKKIKELVCFAEKIGVKDLFTAKAQELIIASEINAKVTEHGIFDSKGLPIKIHIKKLGSPRWQLATIKLKINKNKIEKFFRTTKSIKGGFVFCTIDDSLNFSTHHVKLTTLMKELQRQLKSTRNISKNITFSIGDKFIKENESKSFTL